MFVFIHCVCRFSFADRSMQALLAAVVMYVLSSLACFAWAHLHVWDSSATPSPGSGEVSASVNGYMSFILYSVAGLACKSSRYSLL